MKCQTLQVVGKVLEKQNGIIMSFAKTYKASWCFNHLPLIIQIV